MTATISDVAQHCGVQPELVRHILQSGLAGATPETIQSVLDSAAALGCPTIPKARRMGILYAEESGRGLTHPFFAPILNAVKEAAEARGYAISFINHQAIAGGVSCLEHCRQYDLDGVCLVCVDFSAPDVRELVTSEVPCVTIDHIFKGVPAVISDNETGVQKLVEYAISRGHRRIAFVHGHNNSIVTRTRIHQFRNTMGYYSLPVPPEYVRGGEYDNIELTRNIVLELLKLPERPTCILLPDDIAYLGAQDAARDLGLSIPKDVSFGGYDGIALGQALEPKLTTIRQSAEQIGTTAAQLLIKRIESARPAKGLPVVFPVEFVEGGTISDAPTA